MRKEREHAEFMQTEEGALWLEKKRAEKAAKDNEFVTLTRVNKISESEKAVCFEVNIDIVHLEIDRTRKVWIPKSLMNEDFTAVKFWFLKYKTDELEAEFTKCGNVIVEW
jgi:hypothetical protein